MKIYNILKLIYYAIKTKSLKESYNKAANIYDSTFLKNQNIYSNIIFNYLKKLQINNLNALDLGCGTGILTRKLSNISKKIIGIDFSTGMLQKAKNYSYNNTNQIEYLERNILNLPKFKIKFDVITCLGVLSHILPENFENLVVESNKVLNKNGIIIIGITPLPWQIFNKKSNAFKISTIDRLMINIYNLFQQLFTIDERRGVYTKNILEEIFNKYSFQVDFISINNLILIIAKKEDK